VTARSPEPAERTATGGSRMAFVGVSTASSSIMRIFPRWAEQLGIPDCRLVGEDVALGAPADVYRDLVRGIAGDTARRGALVTTHKIDMHDAAADLFDELDAFASLCGEISSISKRGTRLLGHAKDPLTAGLALEEFLADDHFDRTGGDLLCLGAGGAGTAITWYVGRREDAPGRIVCTDRDQARLDRLREVHERGGLDPARFDYMRVDGAADALLEVSAPGSLVVNATGLGKDLPGSPLSTAARYPRGSVVWELNYRGSLEMLEHARSVAADRGLTLVDGWRYFIHGWSQVIAEVFDLTLTPDVVERLSATASAHR